MKSVAPLLTMMALLLSACGQETKLRGSGHGEGERSKIQSFEEGKNKKPETLPPPTASDVTRPTDQQTPITQQAPEVVKESYYWLALAVPVDNDPDSAALWETTSHGADSSSSSFENTFRSLLSSLEKGIGL